MEKIFNLIFIGLLPGLLASRLLYGLLHAKAIVSSLWTFILVPYYPGLSILGGVIGVMIYFLILTLQEKDSFPLARLFDFFSIAFLVTLPLGFLGDLLFLQTRLEMIKVAIQAISCFIVFIIFLKFFLSKLLTGKFKEGTISLLFLIFFSVLNLIFNAFPKTTVLIYLKNYENIILILLFLLSTGLLFWHENLIFKTKQEKKGKNGA